MKNLNLEVSLKVSEEAHPFVIPYIMSRCLSNEERTRHNPFPYSRISIHSSSYTNYRYVLQENATKGEKIAPLSCLKEYVIRGQFATRY